MNEKNWVILNGYLIDLKRIIYAQSNGEGCIIHMELGTDALRIALPGVSVQDILSKLE